MLKLGGRYAERGIWWSAVDGSAHDMREGGLLPGDTGVMYIRRPPGGAYVVAPLIAVLYSATFPVLGPLAVIISWALALAGMCAVAAYATIKGAEYTQHLAVLGWRPVTAYFSGLSRRRKKK